MTTQDNSKASKTTIFTPSLMEGRFTRAQYWKYYIVGRILFFILIQVYLNISESFSPQAYYDGQMIITCLFLCFYDLPVQVKRVHDFGLGVFLPTFVNLFALGLVQVAGGVWVFVGFAISIVYAVVIGLIDSNKGTNAYGPSVKYPD